MRNKHKQNKTTHTIKRHIHKRDKNKYKPNTHIKHTCNNTPTQNKQQTQNNDNNSNGINFHIQIHQNKTAINNTTTTTIKKTKQNNQAQTTHQQ